MSIVEADGTKKWYRNGRLHRLDGPAIISADGSEWWYENGQNHRLDGPAIILANGSRWWCIDDRNHRLDGPAIIHANGSQAWFVSGLRHREDGPACVEADGKEEWWLIGLEVNEELVENLNSLTANLIHQYDHVELRSWLIARMGWPKYLREINASPIDIRNNEIENTKEALYFISELKQSQLVVTCPTGRVFSLHVPDHIKTCEEAQRWLGNDTKNEFNVIGRT